MKTIYPTLILILILFNYKAQLVFCPSGAEWHFLQKTIGPNANNPWIYKNETLKYTHDTIMNNVTAKILRHTIFFKENSLPCNITLLKQSGDTVFMRNAITQNSWQVLYNFNTLASNGWTNNLGGTNYSTTVTSSTVIFENGYNLKQLTIAQTSSKSQYTYTSTITERFGNSTFLFYFINHFDLGSADPIYSDWVEEFLCYSDNEFGTKKFSTKDCQYENLVGLNENLTNPPKAMVYPNPFLSNINLKVDGIDEMESFTLVITDLYGREVIFKSVNQKSQLDLSELIKGMYFIRLIRSEKIIYSSRLLKE